LATAATYFDLAPQASRVDFQLPAPVRLFF
jgi:hypothetical protein